MVALFRGGRRLHGVVVVDQFRVPLIGLPAQESVEPLESPRQRPVPLAGGQAGLLQWRHVPLAQAIGVVPTLGQYLGDQRGVVRDTAVDARESLGELLHDGHAHRRRVTPGEQRGTGRRTQGGGVELGQTHAAFGDSGHGRHIDQSAEAVPGGDADVVPDHIQHIGCVRGRRRRQVGTPVRRGIADVQCDGARELSWHTGDVTGSGESG